MISIIICSINNLLLEKCKLNFIQTIGVDYEFIEINNLKEKLSLSDAYNKAALVSKFNVLLFIHEDVEFIKPHWGKKLINILKKKEIGVVGVAGSTYLSIVPSGWYMPDDSLNKVYIHQGFKYKTAPIRFDNQGEDLTPVYLLDGVFLAMRKEIWEEFPFNENLEGFHAYDVDICQRVSSKYQNIFTNQIEILHHSEGKVDKNYFDALLNYKKQYMNFNYHKRNYKIEFELLFQFYKHLRCYYDKHECISKILPFVKFKYLGVRGYFSFHKFLRNEK